MTFHTVRILVSTDLGAIFHLLRKADKYNILF